MDFVNCRFSICSFFKLVILLSTGSILCTFLFMRHNANLPRAIIAGYDSVEIYNYIRDNEPFHRGYEGPDQFQLASRNGSDRLLLVFSAYWDDRTPSNSCAKVIVITRNIDPPQMSCQFQLDYRTMGEVKTVPGRRTQILEHRKLLYAAQFVDCCLNESEFVVFPKFLYFFNPVDKFSGVRLRLRRNGRLPDKRRGTIALCVKPFHHKFNDALILIEFVEYYLMMGVQMFQFYSASLGPDVERVLDKYARDGLATVLRWDIHGIKSEKEIWTEGLFGAFNECLYRYMGKYQYLVNVDVDEFIVLKKHQNFQKLLTDVLKPKKPKQCFSGAAFKNEFFYRFHKDHDLTSSKEPYLITKHKNTKLLANYGFNNRSKYIAVPENVHEMANHFIYRPKKGCKMALVSPNVASLHHYRADCERDMKVCLARNYTEDRSIQRFIPRLSTNVKKRCSGFPRHYCYG